MSEVHLITVPTLAPPGTPIRFVQWLVDVGDQVAEDERVAEVVVAGILFYVTALASGYLETKLAIPGMLVSPHSVLGQLRMLQNDPL